jgi:hypothetical protein
MNMSSPRDFSRSESRARSSRGDRSPTGDDSQYSNGDFLGDGDFYRFGSSCDGPRGSGGEVGPSFPGGFGPYGPFYPPPPLYGFCPPPSWGAFNWDPRASFQQPAFPAPFPNGQQFDRDRQQHRHHPYARPSRTQQASPRPTPPFPSPPQRQDDDDDDSLQVLSEWNASDDPQFADAAAVDNGEEGEDMFSSIVVPDALCREIAELMVRGVPSEQSIAISKDFALKFEPPGFSLKPPKLDDWLSHRAKEKDVLKQVNKADDILAKIQLKIMDIAAPLVELYARVSKNTDDDPSAVRLRYLIRSVVVQWARSFAHVSKKRRASAIGIVEPASEFLLKRDDFLSEIKDAREALFTRRFLDLMLTESTNRDILDKCDESRAKAAKR